MHDLTTYPTFYSNYSYKWLEAKNLNKVFSKVSMNKLLPILGLLCFFTWVSCSQNDDDCPDEEISLASCTCPAEYYPVCGCNNKTYPNSCIAGCSGIDNFKLGECS